MHASIMEFGEKQMKWKEYNKVIVPDVEPKKVELSGEDNRKILFNKYRSSLMIRYTSNFDTPEETAWWYCIKDDAFSLENLKSKNRNVVNKGIREFETRTIDTLQYVDQMLEILNSHFNTYDKARKTTEKEVLEKCKILSSNTNFVIIGAFSRDDSILRGYTWCEIKDNVIYLVEQHVNVSYEKLQINAALIYGVYKYFETDILNNGKYICDGERNILHNTNFQSYLIKYFGFRKAYCKLHIIYRPIIGFIVKCIFPFRRLLKFSKNAVIAKISSLLFMEEISRSFK